MVRIHSDLKTEAQASVDRLVICVSSLTLGISSPKAGLKLRGFKSKRPAFHCANLTAIDYRQHESTPFIHAPGPGPRPPRCSQWVLLSCWFLLKDFSLQFLLSYCMCATLTQICISLKTSQSGILSFFFVIFIIFIEFSFSGFLLLRRPPYDWEYRVGLEEGVKGLTENNGCNSIP